VRDDLALVQTVDFFTPIVDDPYTYGRIAALNSLNDVWAMGGEAITALAVAGFPRKGLDYSILGEIFRGGLDVLTENGVALLGGHTVDDNEIKFGYAVTGTVDPERIVRNGGARAGDALLLTKPIGTGVVSTAIKFARAPEPAVAASLESMLTSSREAAHILAPYAHGGTDVTGFGLLGHAYEVAMASKVRLHIDAAAVPLLPHALELAASGNVTRGDRTNRDYTAGAVEMGEIYAPLASLLYDPQTAGGLLVAVDAGEAERLVGELRAAGYPATTVVGRCEAAESGGIVVG
jgi:selenide,water dikinase